MPGGLERYKIAIEDNGIREGGMERRCVQSFCSIDLSSAAQHPLYLLSSVPQADRYVTSTAIGVSVIRFYVTN